MNSDKCSRCVSDRVGLMFVGSVELLQGLGCLGLGIDWDTVLIAFAFVIAGVCVMDGVLRGNINSVLANLIFSVTGIFLTVAGIIKTVIILEANSTNDVNFTTLFLNARSIFVFAALVDVCFLFYVYSFLKKLKEEKQEENCSRILF
jgi:hypothetical protein